MLCLIYGGSGSGKSHYAENLLLDAGPSDAPRRYIATMFPGDAEARRRIARHREERAHKGFVTIERYTDVRGVEIPQHSLVLLECLGNLVANEMFSPEGAGRDAEAAVMDGVETIAARAAGLFIVSNDVFSDGAEYSEETREYCRVLAALHRTIARRADAVVETVCGIPLHHKKPAAGERVLP